MLNNNRIDIRNIIKSDWNIRVTSMPHMAVGCIVSQDAKSVEIDGRKWVLPGTPLSGDLLHRQIPMIEGTVEISTSHEVEDTDGGVVQIGGDRTVDAVGVLINPVDVTDGNNPNGSLMIFGCVCYDLLADETKELYDGNPEFLTGINHGLVQVISKE